MLLQHLPKSRTSFVFRRTAHSTQQPFFEKSQKSDFYCILRHKSQTLIEYRILYRLYRQHVLHIFCERCCIFLYSILFRVGWPVAPGVSIRRHIYNNLIILVMLRVLGNRCRIAMTYLSMMMVD